MKESFNSVSTSEKIINSKKRVQNHGEVFTPYRIVKQMLDMDIIREACRNLTTTFLEPAAGEGVFLMEVLKRKIDMVANKYGSDLIAYENYSLLALSTLYGIELLEDNAQKCVMNMYQLYYEAYQQLANIHKKKMKDNVLSSAKLIISRNIAQGNFLTKKSSSGNPLVFSEWKVINLVEGARNLIVQRTEYTLNDIFGGVEKGNGEMETEKDRAEQIDLFYLFDDEEEQTNKKPMKYAPTKITDVYKEEKEEING